LFAEITGSKEIGSFFEYFLIGSIVLTTKIAFDFSSYRAAICYRNNSS